MGSKPFGSQDPFDRRATSGTTYNAPAEPFRVESLSAVIKFLREGVQPPSPLYIGVDDKIQVGIMAGNQAVTVNVNGRWLRAADGAIVPFTFAFTGVFTRSPTLNSFSLGEGFLLSVNVVSSATFLITPIYATVAMIRGATTGAGVAFQQLIAGWVGGQRGLTWPGGQYQRPVEGLGVIRSITGTTPGAGAEISETAPSQALWRLLAFRFSLTTAVAVANRIPTLVRDDGANIYDANFPNLQQTASLTETYQFANSPVPVQFALNGTLNFWPISDTVWIPGSGRIRTITSGLQAADQYSAPQYLVQEWYTTE